MSDLSAILLAPSAEPVRAVLGELSNVGMVRPVIMIDDDLNSQLLIEGRLEDVDFNEYTAAGGVAFYRLIRLALDGSPMSDRHRKEIDDQARRLSATGARVEKGSLVVPLRGQQISPGSFETYWNYNLILDPTDSAGEALFPSLDLVDPRRQAAVAASAIALVGALWTWLRVGPLDHGTFRRSVGGGSVAEYDGVANVTRARLIRTTTRIVDAGSIVSQAVSNVLTSDVQFPPPPGCVRHGDSQALLDEVVETIVPKQGGESPLGFTYRPEPPPPGPVYEKLSILGAIKRFFKECLDELKRVPAEMARDRLDHVRTAVATTIQDSTFGPDSQLRVEFAEVASADLLDQNKRTQAVTSLPFIKAQVPAETPATWTTLNQLVFGLADASELPSGFKLNALSWNGDRGVISDHSLLVTPRLTEADAGHFVIMVDELESLGWEADKVIHIDGTDVFGARAILARPTGTRGTNVADDESDDEESDPDDSDEDDDVPTDGVTVAQPFDTRKVVGDEMRVRTDDQIDELDEDESDDEGVSDVRKRLGAWRAERERTLAWRLGHGLMQEQDRALDHLAAVSSELQSLLEQLNNALSTEDESRKRFRRWSYAILAILLVGIVLGSVGIIFTLLVGTVVWIGLMVATLVVMLWAMIRTVRKRVRDQNAAQRLERLPSYVSQRRQTAANEYARLSSLYVQLMDWAQVQAFALHRPFGDADDTSVQPWTTTAGALSFVSGKPSIDEEAVAAISLTVAQQVTRRGWITRAYDRQRAMIVDDYTRLAGGVAGSDRPPESDNAMDQGIVTRITSRGGGRATVVYPPRSNLVRQFRAGAAALRFRQEHFDALEGAVSVGEPLDMISVVECDVAGLNTPVRDVERFLMPIVEWTDVPPFTSVAPARITAGVDVRSIVGITSGIEPEHFPPTATTVYVQPLQNRTTLTAFRLDVTDALDLADITLVVKIPPRDGADDLPRDDGSDPGVF